MVELNGELSNQIFSVLSEWEAALQGLSKDISRDISELEP